MKLARQHAPAVLRLASYADSMIYSFRKPDGFTFEQHNEIIKEVAERLEAAGIMVEVIIISFGSYINWLADNNLDDSQQSRAHYVAGK